MRSRPHGAPARDLRPVVATVAALALGLAHAASFSTRHGWWLQLLALAGLLLALERPGPHPARRAGVLAAAFGLGSFCAGIGWTWISMHRYGGLPAPLAAAAVLLLSTYLAAFGTAALVLAERLAPAARTGTGAVLARVAALAACWTLGELARGWLLTGFPWLSLGYAQVDGPLAPAAAVVGVAGLGALTIALAATLAAMARMRAHGARACAVLALVTLAAAAALVAGGRAAPIVASGPAVTVRLLQGNVEQSMKFDPQRALQAMLDYTADVEESPAQLTILPETAWTTPWGATPPPIRARLREHLASTGSFVAIGLPEPATQAARAAAGMLSNSVLVLGPTGEAVGRYDKRQLVPFGEYVPPAFGWFVRMMRIPLGDFARGAPGQAAMPIGGQSFAFDICYEDLFPALLREQVREGASILVNVSNIAWFGHSHALDQHLNISRLRAIELGRPVLRATNTGMTAAIAPSGRVLASLPPLEHGTLDLSVQGTAGLTLHARSGTWPTGLAATLAVTILWLRRRRAMRSG